jgi:hypothetical protein
MPTDRHRSPMLPDDDSLSLIETIQALQGEELPADQDAMVEPDEIEGPRESTLTEMDRGAPPAGDEDEELVDSIDGLAPDGLRNGETDDPEVAAEEGLTYVPPVDPPFVPSEDPDGIEVAAGTGVSALDEPYDDSHHSSVVPDDLEMTARIREALRADAATSPYADRLLVVTIGSRAVIRGEVDDIDDSDAVLEVVGRVAGIDEVDDQTTLTSG